MKKWRCTVCGYIHEGDEPPEVCPQCGAPREKFLYTGRDGNVCKDGSQEVGDLTADVVIAGSGAAAFSAAITARGMGSDAVTIEKASRVGGTALHPGGGYWIPGNLLQEVAGYRDNEDDAVHSIVDIGWNGKAQADYADHLPENKGIRGSMLFSKGYDGKLGYGVNLVGLFEERPKKNGIRIAAGRRAADLVMEDGGTVGVEAESSEGKFRLLARRGVMFGSSYSRNADLMRNFQPSLAPSFKGGLKDNIEKFNGYAAEGKDPEFKRGDSDYDWKLVFSPPSDPGAEWPENGSNSHTAHPIGRLPYYAVVLGSGTLDADGGPVIDGKTHVLDRNEKPIDGLYGTGDCIASPTSDAYWDGGSTIGPAMTFGYIAEKQLIGRDRIEPGV